MAINALVPWTLRQAIDRGFEWYPINVSDFGDAGALTTEPFDENGVNETLISEFPVRGIRIAADSPAARCRIIYNPDQEILGTFTRASPFANVIQLTADTPYIGTLTAPLFVRAARDQMYFDTYTNEAGVSVPFGLAAAVAGAFFQFPDLRLELLLRGSGISATKRRPLLSLVDAIFTLTGGGTEDTIAIIPSDMRRAGRVTVRNPPGNPAGVDFRLLAVEQESPSLPVFTERSTECEIAPAVTVAVGATECIEIDRTLGQYLVIKAVTAGAAAPIRVSSRLED
jgi:hypothetical protein